MADWSTACLDWQERLRAGRPLVPDLPLFQAEKERAMRIFNRLRVPDIIGTPTMAEATGPWFVPIVEVIFGSYDAEIHRRMIQETFLLVPKKNGKSSYAAAIMVVAMIVNRRPNAEFLLIAPTKKIADIAFKQAWNTIKLDEALTKLFHPQEHVRKITHRTSGASLQIMAADTDVITGSKATGILIDETHVFSKKGNAADIFTEVRGALAARPDGFLIQITTQSKDPPSGVFKDELALARDIRDGVVTMNRLAVLYELPPEMAKKDGWKSEKLWHLVNPNLGRSVDIEFLRNKLVTAERNGKLEMALTASQHFNVEVGIGLRNDAWAGGTYWMAAADRSISIDSIAERCEVAVVGIDGGGLDDLLGLSVLGRCRVTRQWLAWHHAWAHDDVLDRRKDIVANLKDFEAEGTLTICEEPTQDIDEVCALIGDLQKRGVLARKHAIGLDPHGIAAIVDGLAEIGIGGEQLVAVPQGFRLNSMILGTERKLKDGTLRHDGSELMTWCVGNAKVEQRGSAVVITKQEAGRAKIDPLIALFNAVFLMSRDPKAKRRSFWESEAA